MRSKSVRAPCCWVGLLVWIGATFSIWLDVHAAPEPPAAPRSEAKVASFGEALRVLASGRYGGRGADLLPQNPTLVQLRTAEVRLIEEAGDWQIHASYELFNPTRAPVPLALIFPEQACEPGAGHDCAPMRGAFLNPQTRFIDKPLSLGLLPSEAVLPFATPPGKGYVYQLTVPPRRPARLLHEYRLERTSGGEWWGLHYVSTAGRYAGPIASVKYVVEVAQPLRYVVFPRAFTLRSFTEEPGKDGAGSLTRLTFTAEKLVERSDFLIAFPGAAVSGQSAAGFCSGLAGDKSPSELAEIIRGYDSARLRGCREHLLALHGFPFSESGLRARYYQHSPRLPAWADEALFTIAARPENPAFAPSLLTPGERAYLKALEDAAPKPR